MQTTEVGVLKLFRLFGLFSLILLFLPFGLKAESFADFKRTQAGAFEEFKDKRDQEFNKYLQEQWREYEAFSSPKFFEKPKPKNIESFKETQPSLIGPKVDIQLPVIAAKIEEKESKEAAQKDIEFHFFGTPVGFNIDHKIKDLRFYPKNQNGIISFFGVMASSDYENLLHDIEIIRNDMQLNDWGVFQLVASIAEKIYASTDEARLFRWFMLSKLSYDVKIGLIQSHIVLLQNSKQLIYSTPRYKIDGIYYYAIDHQNSKSALGRMYTYEKKYPEAVKQLDFEMVQTPKLAQDIVNKKLSFSNQNENHQVDVKLNKNLIDFMNTYPQVDYDVYFNAALDPLAYDDLLKGLRVYINGKKASYSLNFILHFVQKSFAYERDDEQFGKDKVMFAEETLYYDRSDCEDRAILYAKLVKKIFNYGVIGVKYPDHMNTALNVPISGDTVNVGSKQYVIADPTYINANIGRNMPKYKNIQPESFITLK